MAPGVGVRVGQRCALVGVGVVHSWANRGECGGAVVGGPCKRCTRVSDEDGDEFQPSPMLLEGRDEGGGLLGLLRVFLVVSEVPREPNLYEDEGACLIAEAGLAGVGRARDSSGVYEARSCAVASLEEGLCLFRWKYPWGYSAKCRGALGVVV